MPYTWDGKYIESKADARTELISAKEIGGIGELIYHLFRFSEYDWDQDEGKDGATYIRPMCDKNHPPQFAGKRDKATGKEILASLCNLARDIDNFNEKKPPFELILEWCKAVAHPYDIDFIYSELSDERFDAATDGWLVEKDGRFSYEKFMDDLGKLYRVARFYIAMQRLCVAEDDDAYNLYCDGRYFDGLPFFEKYLAELPEIPEDALPRNDGESRDALLKEMQKSSPEHRRKHQSKPTRPSKFARVPYDDYYELRDTLIDLFPDFTIRLKTETKTKGLVFAADVKSVFDIAWYSFARMMASDPPLEKIGKEKPAHQEGIMVCCRCCGRFIIRRNSRQEYCDKEECQKARNSRNQFLFRERKRIEKGQTRRRRRGNG